MDQKINSQIIQDIFIIDSENIYESQVVQQCFDIVGVFVAAVDLNGEITLINRKGRQVLGYDNENVIGQDFISKFINKRHQEKARKLFNSIMQKQSVYPENTKYYMQNKNHEQRIIEAKNYTISDKNGNILGILISGEDVTNYVKNEQRLKNDIDLYRILANNIPDINLYLFDCDTRFILAEGSEMKNNRLASNHFEGKQLKEISNNKLKQIWEPFFDSALAGKETFSEYEFNNYYYLIWVIPLKNNEDVVYSGVAITQNVTERKFTESQLQKSKAEAEKANRAKSDFLARVSHEIRTPLNAILGFTEQLKQTPLVKKQNDYVNIIDKSSEHLLSLINDILVLSKIEARQINFDETPFKIEYTIKYLHNALSVKAKEKNIQFSYNLDKNLDVILLGDAFRLRQILMNLLINAIKFTNSGYVELRAFLKEESENEVKVRFDIIDTGIGINPEHLVSIFEQFNQADFSVSKKYGGTGLGLTICKNLIELQNGSLCVSSQEGIGSTFTFVIPYRKGNETDIIPEDQGEIDSEKLKNKRVLLVDDDSVNRLLGITILEKLNCVFVIASNGKEAIENLNKWKFDLILLDIHMPDINGMDIARYLRYEKRDDTTKIIAVTAAVMKDDIKKYLKSGINDFIIKPYKEIHLFNKMCEILNIKEQSKLVHKAEIILKEELSPKPYNLSELRRMTSNSSAMVNLLNTFIENSENAISRFEHCLVENNWEQIGETAHKILSSYKHLEVHRVVELLTDIKLYALVEKEYDILPSLVDEVLKEMPKIINKLREEVENLSQQTGEKRP